MQRIFEKKYIMHENDSLSEYNKILLNTFDYNHYVYSDYLVCSLPAIAHIIRYCVFVTLLQL